MGSQNTMSTTFNDSSHSSAPRASGKRSWVWSHFTELPKSEYAVCHYTRKDGSHCNIRIKRPRSRSTKSLISHLKSVHKLVGLDPDDGDESLAKKRRQSEHDTLNRNTLKSAIVTLVFDCDLPFNIVERESFCDLVQLLNKDAGNLLTKRQSISDQLSEMYIRYHQHLKNQLISKQPWIAFTEDAWTSPNMVAFMAITAHFITEEFQLMDMLLAVPHVQGKHTGSNFGNMFCQTLEDYSALDMLHTITADSASTNNTMAQLIQERNSSFKMDKNLLGCVAHVINLAAKAALSIFGYLEENNDHELLVSQMDFNFVLSQPDGATVNLKTVLKRVHGLAVYVRASPQRRERFAKVVELYQPVVFNQGINCLILDVETQWNSTYAMFQRALKLRESCQRFCQDTETRCFSLNAAEWGQSETVLAFLENLSLATEALCTSNYPTLNTALPVFILLMKRIKEYAMEKCDSVQLIEPTYQALGKLDKFLRKALTQPAYICATILDPRLKMRFWNTIDNFLCTHYGITSLEIEHIFRHEAKKFETNLNAKSSLPKPNDSVHGNLPNQQPKSFNEEIFGDQQEIQELEGEIRCYLLEPAENKESDILLYWKSRLGWLPSLSKMARCYLAIPATSAPSERVFSKGRRAASWQRANLRPHKLEELLCMKEWHRKIGNLPVEIDEPNFSQESLGITDES